MSDMNTSQDTIIEQLWWVRYFEATQQAPVLKAPTLKGISSGLMERETYVKQLESYVTYELPPGGLPKGPNDAPTSLVFTRTEQDKRIIMQEVYDFYQKTPCIDVHMLIGLPAEFSAREAIALWESGFWRSTKVTIRERNKTNDTPTLRNVSLHELKKQYIAAANSILLSLDRDNTHLSFVLQSYLLQQAYLELYRTSPELPRLLIIAPPRKVASFILAVSQLLPQQLLHDITFNTYEHDIQNQQYRICGTSLSPEQTITDSSAFLLSSYANDFVLNTYAKELQYRVPYSFSPEGPVPSALFQRIIHYVNAIVKSYRYNAVDSDTVRNFLQKMEYFPNLTVEAFLDHYDETFADSGRVSSPVPINSRGTKPAAPYDSQTRQKQRSDRNMEETDNTQQYYLKDIQAQAEAEHTETLLPTILAEQEPKPVDGLTREDIVEAFESQEGYEQLLRDHTSRQQVIDSILAEGGWAWFKKELSGPIANRQIEGTDPPYELIQDINERAINAVLDGKKEAFQDARQVLLHISRSYAIRDLLIKLQALPDKRGYDFIKQYKNVRDELFSNALGVLETRVTNINTKDENLILFILTPYGEQVELDKLLAFSSQGTGDPRSNESNRFSLSPQWKYLLMRQLIETAGPGTLTSRIIQQLESYHDSVLILCKEVARLSEPLYTKKWEHLQDFFDVLVKSQYSYITDILLGLLATPPPLKVIEKLLIRSIGADVVTLSTRDKRLLNQCILFCSQLSLLADIDKWERLQKFFAVLVKSRYSSYINVILLELLDAAHLPLEVIEKLLAISNPTNIASLDTELMKKLFEQYSLQCIQQSPTSPMLWKVTYYTLSSPEIPLKWEYMYEIVRMFDVSQKSWIGSRAEEIAEVLHSCIDSPIRLGMLFRLIDDEMRNSHNAGEIVAGLGKYACRSATAAIKQGERGSKNAAQVEQEEVRFTMYVQFALYMIDPGHNPAAKKHYGNIFLHHLLDGIDQQILDFITEEATQWLPASLGTQWEVKKKEYEKSAPKAPAPAPPPKPIELPASSPPAPSPVRSRPAPASPKMLDAKEEQILKEEEKKVRKALDALKNQEGAWQWATFRMENYVILNAMQKNGSISSDEWQRITLAYEFSRARKDADRARGESFDLENTLDQASRKIENNGHTPRFDHKERQRIRQARQRIAQFSQNRKP